MDSCLQGILKYGGEGGIRKSVLIPETLQAKSLNLGFNLIVGIVAVTI